MPKQPITEANKEVLDAWRAEAKTMTVEKLPAFIEKLTTHYEHDYGTICHAMAAGMQATMRSIDDSPTGGITGFQASCVMWEVLQQTFHVRTPCRLLDYNDLLYPQYASKFTSISPDSWKEVREKAQASLLNDSKTMHPNVLSHMTSVAEGRVPFGLTVAED